MFVVSFQIKITCCEVEKIYEAKPFHRFRENSIFDTPKSSRCLNFGILSGDASGTEESNGASESDVGSAVDEHRKANLAVKLLGDKQPDDPNDDRVELD